MAGSTHESLPSDEPRGGTLAVVAAVLEDSGVLPDSTDLSPERVEPLAGGADGQTYLVKGDDRDVIVKLGGVGLAAESRALEAWKPYSSRVSEVHAVGSVAGPTDGEPIKYLVLAGMRNDEGRLIETAADFLDREPGKAREVGRALGVELHALHQAVGGPGFGNFEDSPGSIRTYEAWGDYLGDFLEHKVLVLRDLGISESGIAGAARFVRGCPAVAEGRWLHGDVSVRNVAVLAYEPVTVGLFDPNPLIGDPSWDIAPMANNVAFNELRHEAEGRPPRSLQRDQDLLAGFRESYPGRPAEHTMLAAQLVQAVLQSEHRLTRVHTGKSPAQEHDATREFIVGLVRQVTT